MIKKILLTALIVLLSGGLLGCWFHFVGELSARGRAEARCNKVDIVLLDSLESAIVDRTLLAESLRKAAVGKKTAQIDLDSIERALKAHGEVMTAQVFTADEQTLAVRLTQRKPVIRLENGSGRWYADPEGYLFPVTNAVDVPIVTGHLPLGIEAGYRGAAKGRDRAWLLSLVEMCRYIDSHPVLRREIAQIDVAADGDIVLFTRTPGPEIIFGDSSGYATKFRKLEAYWQHVLPQQGETRYKTINLKYNNQIICKQL